MTARRRKINEALGKVTLNPIVVFSCEHTRKHDHRIKKAKWDLISLIINAKEGEIITIPSNICKEVRIWWQWEKRKRELGGKPIPYKREKNGSK